MSGRTVAAHNAEPISPPRSWWQWFVSLAVILWLVDVAGQRGWLHRWLKETSEVKNQNSSEGQRFLGIGCGIIRRLTSAS
ncbi:MAG: hypothetical protein KAX40_02730 [Herpetosiphon sp.]|nr:hypothetical protein [Herpetosiphon sp.]